MKEKDLYLNSELSLYEAMIPFSAMNQIQNGKK